MGVHASNEPTPRLGLHNLAGALYDVGILEENSLAALGAYVVDEYDLSVDACF
jgi:hypothetical protein